MVKWCQGLGPLLCLWMRGDIAGGGLMPTTPTRLPKTPGLAQTGKNAQGNGVVSGGGIASAERGIWEQGKQGVETKPGTNSQMHYTGNLWTLQCLLQGGREVRQSCDREEFFSMVTATQ